MQADIFSDISVIWTSLFTWMITALNSIVDLFWDAANNDLTFFGVLAIVAVGISIFFLLVRVIQNFLHFRS